MKIITPDIIEEVRARSDIVSVVELFIPLRKQGNTFKALCPFHQEKTPSFVVNPQRQIFHCFGCGKGGDAFRFVMEHEKMDFIAAVQFLARRAGVDLEQYKPNRRGQRSQRSLLLAINQMAAEFFHQYLLKDTAASYARKYIAERGLSAMVKEYQLGYAPDKWDAFLTAARRKYTEEQLEQAGLIVKASTPASTGKTHYYDRFRERLIFPIQDEQGRVIAFSGRVLSQDSKTAKYVNTPETAIFHKGRVLYAFDKARRAIAEKGALICEGQIDVIRCHAAGFTNAVAAQGTAFTEEHARILKRCTDKVFLVFDSDEAGQNAALRAGEVLLQAGLTVLVGILPAGEDPDSILNSTDGRAKFETILKNSQSVVAFQIELMRQKSSEGQSDTELLRQARAALLLIRNCSGAIQQNLLLQEAAASLNLPIDALQKDLRALSSRSAGKYDLQKQEENTAVKPTIMPPRELALAEHLAAEPELAPLVLKYLPTKCLSDPLCRQLVELSLQAAEQKCPLVNLLSENAQSDEELVKFAAKLLSAPPKIKSEFATNEESVRSLILGIRATAVQKEKERLNQRILDMPEGRERQAAIEEYVELSYDIARLKNWDTAIEIMSDV